MQGVVAIIKYADIQGTTVKIDGRLDRFYQIIIKDATTTTASSHDLLNTWLETDSDMLVEIHKLLGAALTATRTTPVATSPHNTRSRGTTPTLETPSTSK